MALKSIQNLLKKKVKHFEAQYFWRESNSKQKEDNGNVNLDRHIRRKAAAMGSCL
jgi:hypothetical protein